MEIEVQIRAINENTCKCIFENMIRRLDACQEIEDGDISNVTYNKKIVWINNTF